MKFLRSYITFSVIAVVTIFMASCSKSEEEIKPIPVETRNFFMGVTPWPADFNLAELDTSYSFINNHCDIVSHHFDDGIPYEEFFQNQTLPIDLTNNVLYRKTKTNATKKVLLSVSALNLTRIKKADYYLHSTTSTTIQNHWDGLAINHPDVVTTYVKYVNWLITELDPDYVNYGVESNLFTFPAADFLSYKDFLSQVYSQLKTAHPNLPFFVSVVVDESTQGFLNAQQLIPYTDYIALSAYPYVTVSSSASGNTNPALFPANYFEKFITMANKPFCFAETGYIAENLVIPSYSLNKQGNETWQRDYLNKICKLTQQYNGKFIIWFCSKDYDAGVLTLQSMGLFQDLFLFWRDTGLKNQNGTKRASYRLWLEWMNKPKI